MTAQSGRLVDLLSTAAAGCPLNVGPQERGLQKAKVLLPPIGPKLPNTYHREQVRAAFGFRELFRGDEDKLAGWLAETTNAALTPLFWSHINPYRRFRLTMDTHLDLSGTSSTGTGGVELVL